MTNEEAVESKQVRRWYQLGRYSVPTPPGPTCRWTDFSWIKFINACGVWWDSEDLLTSSMQLDQLVTEPKVEEVVDVTRVGDSGYADIDGMVEAVVVTGFGYGGTIICQNILGDELKVLPWQLYIEVLPNE